MMMTKLIVWIVLVTVASAYKHHHKTQKSPEDYIVPVPTKVTCSGDNTRERDSIIEKSKCGEPKEVFEYLKLNTAHEQVSPRAVWVKRCVGLCEYGNGGSCVPTEKTIRHIPIRIYNLKTKKQSCATYPMEEHVSCGCCALSEDECGAPRVFNPRKCACQCPNLDERRNCLKQRNLNMKWNRSKCACEARRRT